MKYACAIFILMLAAPAWGKEKKPFGEVVDAAGLQKAQSFCLDTSELSADETSDLNKFIDRESKPKKLLSRLPWKLNSDCAQANVRAKIQFKLGEEVVQATGMGTLQGTPATSIPREVFRAAIAIDSLATKKPLYRVEGEGTSARVPTLSNAFTKLDHDLKILGAGQK